MLTPTTSTALVNRGLFRICISLAVSLSLQALLMASMFIDVIEEIVEALFNSVLPVMRSLTGLRLYNWEELLMIVLIVLPFAFALTALIRVLHHLQAMHVSGTPVPARSMQTLGWIAMLLIILYVTLPIFAVGLFVAGEAFIRFVLVALALGVASCVYLAVRIRQA